MNRPLRVVVCGTGFGQLYLEALRAPRLPLELAGVVARGSDRSRACAADHQVPLYTAIGQLPADIDIGCVVVRGGLVGGNGSELARELAARGVHVLQEHPVHHDELAETLREARRHRVAYRLNSFYVHQAPVRRFLAAARELLARQRIRYLDVACGFQAAYSALDIAGRLLGAVRPWELAAAVSGGGPFGTIDCTLAGVPTTFRIHHQLDPADPDASAHLLHRITVGAEGGSLTLVTTHGPIVWNPRPGFPARVRASAGTANFYAGGAGSEEELDVSSGHLVGPAVAPSHREIFGAVWPAGIEHALGELRRDIVSGASPMADGQYHLMLCRLWQDIAARLGPPRLVREEPSGPLTAGDLLAMAEAGERAVSAEPVREGSSR
ncbi:Gfo/Idh/MocA family oxidoreductase [Amycolatopsis sp. NPDC004079]|uniref:Gfo/Idh/MocA family oxidoreductase n=1 Tax=Amycolatopsis sp. NPDC004079 TaxID=3154549 RepID=UPI0033A9560B